ncbi:protein kinase, putative [Phytophthora infestans T30-4]|uniref:Protein kinase, putative n=1 Tax=Phytophthora infestans (strain T30-4) TaxID=403677 RepID=D0NVW0_PHYIT|nr:protein kinase, putative [Phytophthora infestans T30-4]EEY66791.1 protein kinase, putative [Phytophthora infestans T30-4]|eukprot:XP_002896856.1 protein kinase, putative [Phytophthora infestans T30-4]
MEAVEIFSGANCAGTPDVLAVYNVTSGCAENACSDISFGNDTYYISRSCNISDRFAHTEQVFGDFTYVIMETYDNKSCTSFGEADTFLASGSCEISSGLGDQSAITILFPNGSAVVSLYPNNACGGEPSLHFELSKTALSTGSCQQGLYRFYSSESSSGSGSTSSTENYSGNSSNSEAKDRQVESSTTGSDDSSKDSSISTGGIFEIVAGSLVFILLVSLLVAYHLRKKHEDEAEEQDTFTEFQSPRIGQKNNSFTAPGTLDSHLDDGQRGSQKPLSLVGLWDDEVIATARISREKIVIQRHLCRGGGGEVYKGLFNQQQVAIKMLLPDMRKSVKHVNAFLAEVKLMATLDHPRIVQFVGVAWDSLTDLCVVSEFMEGGDLRGLLTRYQNENHPTGFDRTKVTIALHVAHALTYLHSLETPVLHRDLKSKNVLLTSSLEVKLTDFRISREQADRTMTAGVGTSLWMAPEVMLGERYDDKADTFSFGVLLSELDVHVLPYSHVKERWDDQAADTLTLQKIALGQLQVDFSSSSLPSMVDLGLSCVSLDPKQRPTSAEALHQLHIVLSQELLKLPVNLTNTGLIHTKD